MPTSVRWLAVALSLHLLTPLSAGPVSLPGGGLLENVDFERHVQALFGKHGCAAGACHGSFQGKGGLYLSLFGYSPEKDHQAFTREAMGRRISSASPDQSLLLLKATGAASHGGGKRIDRDSWQYQVLREWIAAGAPWKPGTGQVKRLDVSPREVLFRKPGETASFKVLAEFADGTRQDVTGFCQFQVNDEYVAELAGSSAVRGLRPGDSAIIISYRGNVTSARALVQVPVPPGFVYPRVPEANLVDREVFAKLRQLNIVPSALSSDAEFLRRVTIDTIGSLPSPEEVRKFLADSDPEKRSKKIDELLRHPLHAALWATKFSDITGNSVDILEPTQSRPKRSKMWHDWFRKRVADNVPYDEIARGVLTATSRDGLTIEDWVKQTLLIDGQAQAGWDSSYADRKSLDLFWRRQNFQVQQMGEHTAAAFLGIRLECAQCHKHPFDRWTQDDYRAYSQVFAGVRFVSSPEAQKLIGQQQGELRKKQTEELAALEKEFAARKKPLEEQIEKEFADRKKAIEKKTDREIVERRQALEKQNAREPADRRKAALERFEREVPAIRKKALATLDNEIRNRLRQALADLERELQRQRQAIQAKYRSTATALREVTVGPPATPSRSPNRPPPTAPPRPKALGGPELPSEGDARVGLFEWMRTADNPFFARSFVNRVWAHYFGRGLVDPVDNFSVANPPSNEKLLDALAQYFVENRYDIRKLERLVLESRTYQLSATPNDSNRDDRTNHSRSYPRRLMAEQVVDVLNTALGATENFGPEVPPGIRAVEIAPSRLQQNQNLANVFRLFGRPTRTATCDCERPAEPALPQTLYLMTDPVLMQKITGGRLKELIASKKSDEEVIEEILLATLSRQPTSAERQRLLAHLGKATNRQTGLVDIVWAIINMREFILNH